MTVYRDPPRARPKLVWLLTALFTIGVIVALIALILNIWWLLIAAVAVAVLSAVGLWPAGVMSHVSTDRSATTRGPK